MLAPIGEMREPVAILTPTTTKDEAGGETTSYSASSLIWAAVRPASTKERVQFGQVAADATHVLFGHWDDFRAVPSNARIRNLETLEEFDITGLPLNAPDRSHTRLHLVARENG